MPTRFRPIHKRIDYIKIIKLLHLQSEHILNNCQKCLQKSPQLITISAPFVVFSNWQKRSFLCLESGWSPNVFPFLRLGNVETSQAVTNSS